MEGLVKFSKLQSAGTCLEAESENNRLHKALNKPLLCNRSFNTYSFASVSLISYYLKYKSFKYYLSKTFYSLSSYLYFCYAITTYFLYLFFSLFGACLWGVRVSWIGKDMVIKDCIQGNGPWLYIFYCWQLL